MDTTRLAVVIGGRGGIGAALGEALLSHPDYDRVISLSRRSTPVIDFAEPETIAIAAGWLSDQPGEVRLVIDATGFLHDDTRQSCEDFKRNPARDLSDAILRQVVQVMEGG